MEHGSTGVAADGAAQADLDARWQSLRGEVDRQLALFWRRRRRDKRKAFGLQMATVTLSATVTVLLGLRTSDATRTRLLNIALGLGALITVLAAAEAFFTHRRLWVLRTTTVRRLETLSRHVDFHTAGADGGRSMRARSPRAWPSSTRSSRTTRRPGSTCTKAPRPRMSAVARRRRTRCSPRTRRVR